MTYQADLDHCILAIQFLYKEDKMNAIILAGGHGSRMIASNQFVHKPLLPIQGIPNIERTILMLKDFGVEDITIIAGIYANQYFYLHEKFNCTIISNSNASISTLYGIYNIIDKISDTFIIEGDVVLAENVFKYEAYSYYYIMKYPNPEKDAWKPVLRTDGSISKFEIGHFSEPCIFGISFWSEKDSVHIKNFIYSICTKENLENSQRFWDDYFIDILSDVPIFTYEISSDSAIEMNTATEYSQAKLLCEHYYSDLNKYFLHLHDSKLKFSFSLNEDVSINYTKKLLQDYNYKHPDNIQNLDDPIEYISNEYPFIVNMDNNDVAFIDLILEKQYILLRRLYVNESYRNCAIGTQIVKRLITLSKLLSKELRVNVYDEDAARFYKRLGFKYNFVNYFLRGNDYGDY